MCWVTGSVLCCSPGKTFCFPTPWNPPGSLRKATQKRCGAARDSSLEAQFPVLPALRMKSELLLLYLRVLCLGDTAGHGIRDPTCPRFHTEIWSEP